MDSRQFRDKVLQYFRFLIDDYGFSLLSSKNYYPEGTSKWIVIFRLNDCWMEIMLDKVQVFIDVGLFSTPKDWFDLAVVTAYLTRETGAGEWEYDFELIDRQLARLAGILRQYCDQIIKLFRDDVFKEKRAELDAFRKKRSDERLKQLLGKK